MWNWIRTKLGLDRIADELHDMESEIKDFRLSRDALKTAISIHNMALGRIITKIDPMYNAPTTPGDPGYAQRKAESDAIANSVISRLISEYKASNPQ